MARNSLAYFGGTMTLALLGIIGLALLAYTVLWLLLGGPGVFNVGHATVTVSSTAQPQYDYQTPHY